ncbi:MAG: GNAT family N-acetyltransferase [Acidimicrobiales bacterium]
MNESVRLRQVRPDDVAWMAEMAADRELVGEHNWSGAAPDPAEVEQELLDRLAVDGCVSPVSGQLVVEVPGGPPVGDVSWRSERWGPSPKSRCVAIGIALLPRFRGLGYGTVAQRLLVGYLFDLDPELHRVQSDTAVDNMAERRSLTKIGMVEEGRVREAEYRDGAYHDHFVYSILRPEWLAQAEQSEPAG